MNETEIKYFAEIIKENGYVTEYQDSRFHKIFDSREDHKKNYNALNKYCEENYGFEIAAASYNVKKDGYSTIVFRLDAEFAYDNIELTKILDEEYENLRN